MPSHFATRHAVAQAWRRHVLERIQRMARERRAFVEAVHAKSGPPTLLPCGRQVYDVPCLFGRAPHRASLIVDAQGYYYMHCHQCLALTSRTPIEKDDLLAAM